MTQFSADAYSHDAGAIGDLDSLWALPENLPETLTETLPENLPETAQSNRLGHWHDVTNATQTPAQAEAADLWVGGANQTWSTANPFDTNIFLHPADVGDADDAHDAASNVRARPATGNGTTILSATNPSAVFPTLEPTASPTIDSRVDLVGPSSAVLMAVSAATSVSRNGDHTPAASELDNETGFQSERTRPGLPVIVGGLAVTVLLGLTAFTVLGSSGSAPTPTLLTNSNPATFPRSTLAAATTISPTALATPGQDPVTPQGKVEGSAAQSESIFQDPSSTEIVADGPVGQADSEVVFGETAGATSGSTTSGSTTSGETQPAAPATTSNDAAAVLIVPDGAPLPTP